jgi:hypothetical protein
MTVATGGEPIEPLIDILPELYHKYVAQIHVESSLIHAESSAIHAESSAIHEEKSSAREPASAGGTNSLSAASTNYPQEERIDCWTVHCGTARGVHR